MLLGPVGILDPAEQAISIMSKPNAKNFDTPDTPASLLPADFELLFGALLDRAKLSADFDLLLECFMLACEFTRDEASEPNTRTPWKGNS